MKAVLGIVFWLVSVRLLGASCHCETHVFYSIESARKVKPECVDTLILADVGSIPDLCSFTQLKYLHIRNHTLRSLPSSMLNCLKRLEVLKINYGLLQSVPVDLDLGKLKELDLSQNKIDSIAGPLDQIKNVRVLRLSNNPLHYVEIEAILRLRKLQLLSLYRNSGERDLLDPEKRARMAGTLKNCTLWFEPAHPYTAP